MTTNACLSLPIEAWPGDIKIRLADVRKNLNK